MRILSIIVVLISCTWTTTKAASGNLISGDGKSAWNINFYGGSKNGSGTFEVTENGQKIPCIHIAGFEQKTTGQAVSKQKIAVRPGEKLILNFGVKSSRKSICVQLRFMTKSNRQTGKYVLHITVEPETWTELTKSTYHALFFGVDEKGNVSKRVDKTLRNQKSLIVPPNSEYVKIYLFNSGLGTTLYRNISLINLSATSDGATQTDSKVKKQIKKLVDKALEKEAKRLLMSKEAQFNKNLDTRNIKKLELVIDDVKLPTDYKMTDEKFPERGTNIRIDGGNFTRDGKPVFLLGVESSGEVFPWRDRAFGVDFVHMNDVYVMSVMRFKKTADKLHLWWEPYKWMETQIRLLLKSGMAVYVQPIEGGTIYKPGRSKLRNELEKHGAVTNTSHFVGFRLDDPLGIRLRNNFWKRVLEVTRKYPVFMYEMYNEMRYSDYSPANIAIFREAMRDKYKTIDYANKVWGTNVESFASVMPPIKGNSEANTEFQIRPKNFSRMLLRDWGVFLEKQVGKHLMEFRHFIKKYEKSPYAYLTTQTYFNMPMSYVSVGGEYPEEIIKSEDVVGMEYGGSYRDQFEGEENPYEIKYMLRHSFIRNCIGNISEKKPLMGEECVINKNDKIADPQKYVIKLHGKWKFIDDPAAQGVKKGYQAKDFKDSDWSQLNVPGMWGQQGFADCQIGWYRKTFMVPEALKGRQLFLNGQELADTARIYLNGKLIKETKKWSEKFSINISNLLEYGNKNTLAIRIICRYKASGFHWGGIRNFIAINKTAFFEIPRLTEGEMRDWFWSQMFNGFSGFFMSYAYSSDNRNIFSPKFKTYESIRAIPKIKNEINSLGEIVLPKPRLNAKTAMIFPFETGRPHIYKKHGNWMKAPLLHDIMDFYCPVLFKQLDVDVISNNMLLRNGLAKYNMFIMIGGKRVQKGTVDELDRFVKNGGILVVNYNSLKVEDEFNKPIPTPEFLGCKPGKTLPESQHVSSDYFGFENVATVLSNFMPSYGVDVKATGANVLATYANGKPAITMNSYGKGRVYYIGCELNYIATNQVISKIVDESKIEKTLQITSDKPAGYIEAHNLGRNGRYVWYIFNWGGGVRQLNVARKQIPDGNYRIVDVVKNKVVVKNISASKLRQGITATLKSHDPLIYLVEDITLKPTQLKPLTPKEKKFVSMWRASPKGETRVLMGAAGAIMTRSRMMTAVNMLENLGFEFSFGMNEFKDEVETFNKTGQTENLSDFKIITFMGNTLSAIRYPKKVQKSLEKFVKEGGSLLLAANYYVGPHQWQSNKRIAALPKPFGVEFTNTNIRDEKEHGFVPDFPAFTNIAEDDDITKGVKLFQSRGMSMLKVTNPEAKILVKAGQGANYPGASAMVALNYGKGRVVIMGNARWMKPDQLDKGDNAQLLINIFNWLARKPVKVYPKNELEKMIDNKFE